MPRVKNKQINVVSDFNMNNQKLTNVLTPTLDNDAATKAYVDAMAQGLIIKTAVDFSTTSSTDLSNCTYVQATDKWTTTGTVTFDSNLLANSARILVKNATDKRGNGIWVYSSLNNEFTRALDSDNVPAGEFRSGVFVYVNGGTLLANSGWAVSSPIGDITLGTDLIDWGQISGSTTITAGTALTKTGNTLNVNVGTGLNSTGNTINVKADGDSVAISTNGIKAATLTNEDELVINTGVYTAGIDNANTGITISSTPAGDSDIDVFVNGIKMTVSYASVSTNSFYFSNDSGVTARLRASIVAGDRLYFNAVVTGYSLDLNDRISLVYSTIK